MADGDVGSRCSVAVESPSGRGSCSMAWRFLWQCVRLVFPNCVCHGGYAVSRTCHWLRHANWIDWTSHWISTSSRSSRESCSTRMKMKSPLLLLGATNRHGTCWLVGGGVGTRPKAPVWSSGTWRSGPHKLRDHAKRNLQDSTRIGL